MQVLNKNFYKLQICIQKFSNSDRNLRSRREKKKSKKKMKKEIFVLAAAVFLFSTFVPFIIAELSQKRPISSDFPTQINPALEQIDDDFFPASRNSNEVLFFEDEADGDEDDELEFYSGIKNKQDFAWPDCDKLRIGQFSCEIPPIDPDTFECVGCLPNNTAPSLISYSPFFFFDFFDFLIFFSSFLNQ